MFFADPPQKNSTWISNVRYLLPEIFCRISSGSAHNPWPSLPAFLLRSCKNSKAIFRIEWMDPLRLSSLHLQRGQQTHKTTRLIDCSKRKKRVRSSGWMAVNRDVIHSEKCINMILGDIFFSLLKMYSQFIASYFSTLSTHVCTIGLVMKVWIIKNIFISMIKWISMKVDRMNQ